MTTSFSRSKSSLNATGNQVNPSLPTSSELVFTSQGDRLLFLLRQHKIEEAWVTYTQCGNLPDTACLSRLVCQLSYQNTQLSLTRAQSIISSLRHEEQLNRLDANSLDLLTVAAAKAGNTQYAVSIVKSMLRSGYLPHVKAWSAAVSCLSGSEDDGPMEARRLFASVMKRVRMLKDPDMFSNSRPDTGAYNVLLNACANLGDTKNHDDRFFRRESSEER